MKSGLLARSRTVGQNPAMVRSLHLCATHRHRVNHERLLRFGPGINVIIGPNGTGKSTVLRCLHRCPDCVLESDDDGRTVAFHSAIDNPQEAGYEKTSQLDSILHTRGLFASHGQIMRDVLATLPFGPGDTLLLDEPEAGQDVRWIEKIRNGLSEICTELGVQVIMATHHPLFFVDSTVIELSPGYGEEIRRIYRQYL